MHSISTACTRASRRLRHWAENVWRAGWRQLAATRGQGTVEYVGIVIVVGVLLIAVKAGIGKSGAHDIATKITDSVTQAVQDVVGGKGKSG
jgi:hypothetical protein